MLKSKHFSRVWKRNAHRLELDESTGCWNWTGPLNEQGRPFGGTSAPHRRFYRYIYGEAPKGWHLHHECRNIVCCNPDHMRPMPMVAHQHLHWPHDPNEVREWGRNPDVTLAEIAEHFGISQMSVQNILYGRRWLSEVDLDEDTRPVRYCAWSKCGRLIEGGRRHKKACCSNHREYARRERAEGRTR